MKKLVTGLFAIAITCTAMAQTQEKKAEPVKSQTEMQPGDHKGGEPKDRMEYMMEKLNLTADQKEKMNSINQDFKKQMDEFKDQQMTEEDRRGQRMELMMARKEKISAVLTADQRKQWEEMKEQRGGGRGMRKADK